MNPKLVRPLVWEAWVENSAYYYESLLSSASVDIPKKGTLVAQVASLTEKRIKPKLINTVVKHLKRLLEMQFHC